MGQMNGKKDKLTRAEVEQVALLARLNFTESEKELFTRQLNSILGYFEKLEELDTEKVEPTSHVSATHNVFRGDNMGRELEAKEALLNAPDGKNECFRVPRIIEE